MRGTSAATGQQSAEASAAASPRGKSKGIAFAACLSCLEDAATRADRIWVRPRELAVPLGFARAWKIRCRPLQSPSEKRSENLAKFAGSGAARQYSGKRCQGVAHKKRSVAWHALSFW